MEGQYIFTETASGDRTNIMASFPLWDKDMFLAAIKTEKEGRYRYGKIGEYMSLLKDMRLEEFETVFKNTDFSEEQITTLFRKEVSEKYGRHAADKAIKPIPKKELCRGCVYEDFTGKKWVYFGEVEKTVENYKKQVKISKGLGFNYYYNDYTPGVEITIIKSAKKLKSKVNGLKIELKEE